MDHLTTEQIIEFVTFDEMNADTIKLAAKVNAHILKCPHCLDLVQSYQLLDEAFDREFEKAELERQTTSSARSR